MEQIGFAAEAPVLHEVRAACRRVASEALLVDIDDGAVADLARRLDAELNGDRAPGALPDPWAVDPEAGTDEQRAGLALILATINFGSGYHPHVRKRPGCSGATTMATALREWAATEALTARRLTAVTAAEAHERFGQPPDGAGEPGGRDELMRLFAGALAELGAFVLDHHGGSFLHLVASADGRAAGLVATLGRLASFGDVAEHRGRPVPLYKRAQLAVADLDRAFAGRAPARFADLDDLTAFADNLVPHVLRIEGVLRYDGALAARIDAGRLLAPGSVGEVEIRAVGVHAVERLRAALGERGTVVRSSDLDARLWRRGGAARFKAVPRHRTRTVFY
jgi:hypothetical protein